MIGTKRARKRARTKLHCELIYPSTWRVWGGENQHIVSSKGGEFFCDCTASIHGSLCSHKIRVGMEIAPDLFSSPALTKLAPKYETIKNRLKRAKIPRDKSFYKPALELISKDKNYSSDILEVVAERIFTYFNGGHNVV